MSSTRTVPRIGWPDVAPSIRAALEDELDGRVVAWVSQEEGFSPGLAARCRLDDGRRVFVKAVSVELNAESEAMARHEVTVNRRLPADAPAPRLLASVDRGGWVASAWADIEGRLPSMPWRPDELQPVLDAVDALRLPAVATVPAATARLDRSFSGWRMLARSGVDGELEPWIDESVLRRLAEREATWTDHCPPEALVHTDIRADNVLLDAAGRVWIVDWANAALGPPWLDVVCLLPSVEMQGGPPAAGLWARSSHADEADPEAVDAVVVALAGFFTAAARQPPVPAIPMLRPFQEAQARPARAWMRQRLGLG